MLNKKKGFTLLEVIAVITLLIVIGSMTVPAYTKIVGNQQLKADLAIALQLEQHAKTYYIENKNTDETKLKKYIEEIYGKMPESKYYKKDFSVTINDSQKPIKVTVSSNGKNFIENGEAKELKAD